jgi:hypothetical protein
MLLRWHRRMSSVAGSAAAEPADDLRWTRILAFVLRLAAREPRWGHRCRIVGELRKLGFSLSETSVRKMLRRHGIAPATAHWSLVPRVHRGASSEHERVRLLHRGDRLAETDLRLRRQRGQQPAARTRPSDARLPFIAGDRWHRAGRCTGSVRAGGLGPRSPRRSSGSRTHCDPEADHGDGACAAAMMAARWGIAARGAWP